MFRPSQVIFATQLIRHFSHYAHEITANPWPILVVQKNGEKLVIMAADTFEQLFEAHLNAESPVIREPQR